MPRKSDNSPQRRGSYVNSVKKPLQKMEGELLKVGKRMESFVPRFYVLKDSALLAYKNSDSTTPTGKYSSAKLVKLNLKILTSYPLYRCDLLKRTVH